ncbi:hypothetical protein [Roseateles aquae]|uniref:hypothetical protein n=1 Tax=Roseateles aquae TaxID=3077235 RepID=UPI0028E19CCE|nr:hypothetical protein [Paucibacter sp. APW11]
MFTVLRLGDSKIAVQKQGLGAQFTGTMTEAELSADVSYEIGNSRYAESLTINRFTGELQTTIRVGKGGLIHFGTCGPATQPIF